MAQPNNPEACRQRELQAPLHAQTGLHTAMKQTEEGELHSLTPTTQLGEGWIDVP